MKLRKLYALKLEIVGIIYRYTYVHIQVKIFFYLLWGSIGGLRVMHCTKEPFFVKGAKTVKNESSV